MKPRQAGIPQMQLRQWYAAGFVQDNFQLAHATTVEMGVRQHYIDPLVDSTFTNCNRFNHTSRGAPEGFLNTPPFGTITQATTPAVSSAEHTAVVQERRPASGKATDVRAQVPGSGY